jgi:hypothetical protein
MSDQDQTTEEEQTETAGIGMGDIAACVQIIDIVTKRGAFEGSELSEVGTVRNRLAAFLKANKPAETEEAAEPDEVT